MEILGLVLLLLVTYSSGSFLERRHYKSIRVREVRFRRLPLFVERTSQLPSQYSDGKLVSGNVVISVDYFKRFLAGLRSILGGRVKAYESLIDRGRREAILRMKEEAYHWGAQEIVNMRFSTSVIGGNPASRGKLGSVEVMVYGTALK